MGDKSGNRVSKILHRHIGEGVDLYSGREGGHNRRTEAVDPSLYHQDAEIHDGLLDAGKGGEADDLLHAGEPDPDFFSLRPDQRKFKKGVNGDSDSRNVLGNNGRLRGSCDAPL